MQTMRRMKVLLAAPLLLSALLVHAQQNKTDDAHALIMDGKAARLVISLKGGVIKEFRLQGGGRNPLHSLGHFLCLDRWGQPSAAEAKNGMPFHGEASQVEWHVLRPPEKHEGAIEAELAA